MGQTSTPNRTSSSALGGGGGDVGTKPQNNQQQMGLKPTGGSTPTAAGRGNAVPSTQSSSYLFGQGPVERGLVAGNTPGTGFAGNVAGGMIPPGIMQQYQDQQRINQARILEGFGGARFGTDALGVLGRESTRGLTGLLASTEGNALSAQNQLFSQGQALMAPEVARQANAQQLQYQDFLRSTGLPPEIGALLGLAGLGGGTTTGTASGSTSTDILSQILGSLSPKGITSKV